MADKRSVCEALISGKWYQITSKVLREYEGEVLRRCPECKSKIKLMKEGIDGQKAHFEHYTRNSDCSQSIAFGKHKEFGKNKHVRIEASQKEIDESHQHEAILQFVFNPPPAQSFLCEDIDELYRKAGELKTYGVKPDGQEQPAKTTRTTDVFIRDVAVVSFVLERASGVCELCQSQAPFARASGEPYLEVHHVIHLANGGADTVENSVAVCPNCHKEFHYGENSSALTELVYKKVPQLLRQ